MKKIIIVSILVVSGLSLDVDMFGESTNLERKILEECALLGDCGDSKRENCSRKKKDICVISLSCKKRGAEYSGDGDDLLIEIF